MYGVARKELIAFSSGGKKFSHEVILAAYLAMLDKLGPGGSLHSYVTNKKTVLQSVMRDYHIFRGGREYKTGDDSVEKYYRDLIEECVKERNESESTVVDTLTGRRVSVRGDMWGLSNDEFYIGLIGEQVNYRRNGKRVKGYKVLWSDGVTEKWLTKGKLVFLYLFTISTHMS